ncbi:MAG: lactate utilization protein [Candidatus Hydrogenedentota bacterium]
MLDTYKEHLESLRGHFHRASSMERATDIILSIVRETNADCVATAHLPESLQTLIAGQCAEYGIELLAEPYSYEGGLQNTIDRAQVGISGADFAIAQTSTLVEITTNDDCRLVSSLPRTHIGIVYEDDFVDSLEDASPVLRKAFALHDKNCVASFISGPSRTGDIELRLTLGVHGPEIVHTIVIPREN